MRDSLKDRETDTVVVSEEVGVGVAVKDTELVTVFELVDVSEMPTFKGCVTDIVGSALGDSVGVTSLDGLVVSVSDTESDIERETDCVASLEILCEKLLEADTVELTVRESVAERTSVKDAEAVALTVSDGLSVAESSADGDSVGVADVLSLVVASAEMLSDPDVVPVADFETLGEMVDEGVFVSETISVTDNVKVGVSEPLVGVVDSEADRDSVEVSVRLAVGVTLADLSSVSEADTLIESEAVTEEETVVVSETDCDCDRIWVIDAESVFDSVEVMVFESDVVAVNTCVGVAVTDASDDTDCDSVGVSDSVFDPDSVSDVDSVAEGSFVDVRDGVKVTVELSVKLIVLVSVLSLVNVDDSVKVSDLVSL